MNRQDTRILREWPAGLKVVNYIKSRYDYADIVRWCLHEKGGITEVAVFLAENPNLLHKFSVGDEYDLKAALFPTAVAHSYQLFTDDPTPEMVVHECVHLWQFERGDLVKMPDWSYSWKGEQWPKDTPYRARPWEKEAFDLQGKWWKEYKKSI